MRQALRTLLPTFVSLCIVLWSHSLAAQSVAVDDVPNPRATHSGWVTDGAQVLGPYAAMIEQRLTQLHNDTGAEIAVTIVPSIGDANVREFATALFQHWGIGRKDKDDGVLVLHVLDQRRIEIETGYGIEGTLPDAKCSWLIQEVAIPLFKQDDFARGHLALSAGLDMGIRYPQFGHDQLVAVANQSVQQLPPYVAPQAVAATDREQPLTFRGALEGAKERHVPTLLALLGLCIPALLLRLRAHKALYREKARKYTKPIAPWAFGVGLSSIASIFAIAEPEDWFVWVAYGVFVLTFFLIGGRALQVLVQAKRRHAPRVCDKCKQPMARLSESDDDAKLQYGQQVEEWIQSVDYDVWTCACANATVFEYQGAQPAKKCAACSYKTDRLTQSIVLRPATRSSQGLKQEHYQCAHCQAQRTEEVAIPRVSSSSSSSSSSSGGSSFGGGRSGGGGSGGSY